MGVPKFYRWLSERYPCLSQVIKEHQIPDFDNLYLDMNGIIHPCSHPNDDDPHFRITEAEIFKNIFNYIEVLFRIIKPKKNFFMAVDGCAPRAKMNQQRSRRFRTAKEAEDNIRKAQLKGQTLPKEERFDSNCITPGTEFMARLQSQLQYFINKKISTDVMWQDCNIYLSGHDVPGEGEHKIMDFIRYCKSQPGYDPNTRHCLYGLDADLIMLGLTSHEPHFALLREEVRFGKQAKRITKPEQQTFHLLHLSLLREYLEFEFSSLKKCIRFKYDIERIIDDWVLLGFLVGNDFVPNLPNLHINHDALPYLFGIYKEFLPTTSGYLHDGGYIELHRLKSFFQYLSKFDKENFENQYADLKWLESKTTGNLLNAGKRESPYKKKNPPKKPNLSELNRYEALANNIASGSDEYGFVESINTTKNEDSGVKSGFDRDNEGFQLEFNQFKRGYYKEKFDLESNHIPVICHEYVRALQWIAHYYFNGLQSWSWYYPYHYSPFISDVANWEVQDLHFDLGEPFHPFEQLLAVLPAASKKLSPKAFQHLMYTDTSPIIEFYPLEFKSDLNGKQQEWEAVVLIPFIDEKRLLQAMSSNYSRLTDEEKLRNQFGQCFHYVHDNNLNFHYASPYPEVFEDIKRCQGRVEKFARTHFHLEASKLKKGLLADTKLDVYFPGFPTMRHLKHKAYLKKCGVKVFTYNSRNENMIVEITENETEDLAKLAEQLIGKTAYVEWPYMIEALVTAVSNDRERYDYGINGNTSKTVEGNIYDKFNANINEATTYLMKRRGIKLPNIQVLVEAKPLLGKRATVLPNGKVIYQKEYTKDASVYPAKMVVKDLSVNIDEEKLFESIEMLYPLGSTCYLIANPHYGSKAEVISYESGTKKIRLMIKISEEPSFEKLIKTYDSMCIPYFSENVIAHRLGISLKVLSRITGDLMVSESEFDNRNRVNFGLKLKYTRKKKEVLGFSRYVKNTWTYSPQTEKILREYMDKFPEVFETIQHHSGENYTVESFAKKKKKKNSTLLNDVKGFLKKLPTNNIQTVRCGNSALDSAAVMFINNLVENIDTSTPIKVIKLLVKPHAIFRPTEGFGKLSPDPNTDFLLLDRVVNVEQGITVPVDMHGTVVGIHQVPIDENDENSMTETKYEVLFDEEFLGAITIRTIQDRGYFMNGYSLLNISYGERKLARKRSLQDSELVNFKKRITFNNTSQAESPPKNANKNRLGPNHTESDREVPNSDYWLKGAYSRKSSSPAQPSTSKEKEPSENEMKVDASNDFMNTWKALENEEKIEDKKSNVNQDATNVLQQILNINQKEDTHQQQQEKSQITQLIKQEQTFNKPNIRGPIILQHPLRPQPQLPRLQQSTMPPFMQPTLVLLQYCLQNKLPDPIYSFGVREHLPQGEIGHLEIGDNKFNGKLCRTREEAAEDVASVALSQLINLPPPVMNIIPPPIPIILARPPPNLQPQPPQMMYQRIIPGPQQFVLSQPQQQFHQQQQPLFRPQGLQSDTGSLNVAKADEGKAAKSKNKMFVPHQVTMKNSKITEHSSAPPSINTNDKNINNSLETNVLKQMLGIHHDETDTTFLDNSVPSTDSSSLVLQRILGISSETTLTTTTSTTTNIENNAETELKGLLGLKQTSNQQPKSDLRGERRSDDETNILNSRIESFSLQPTRNTPPPNLTSMQSGEARCTPTKTDSKNSSPQNDGSQKPKKAQIKLAANFQGSKKTGR